MESVAQKKERPKFGAFLRPNLFGVSIVRCHDFVGCVKGLLQACSLKRNRYASAFWNRKSGNLEDNSGHFNLEMTVCDVATDELDCVAFKGANALHELDHWSVEVHFERDGSIETAAWNKQGPGQAVGSVAIVYKLMVVCERHGRAANAGERWQGVDAD